MKKKTGEFFKMKRNRMELSTSKILEENLLQSAFHQTLGDEFTIQQDNNLKHKAISTLELLTKKTVNGMNSVVYICDWLYIGN